MTRVFSDESVATNGAPLVAVPSNVGARTMPNYPALAAKGHLPASRATRIRVFAGQRKETFAIDLASAFDTLNFRRNPPVLDDAEDASNSTNPFGINDFEELNVNTIAVEVPISRIAAGRRDVCLDEPVRVAARSVSPRWRGWAIRSSTS